MTWITYFLHMTLYAAPKCHEHETFLLTGGQVNIETNQRMITIQNLVFNENKWSLSLCDRGNLDRLAYWPETEAEFYSAFQSDKESEFKKI